MSLEIYRCQKCGTPIQAKADYCVLCFAELHMPCPNCMDQWPDGTYHPKKKGKPLRAVDCACCNNERFILAKWR